MKIFKKKAFTLIELIVVVSVIGVLMALILPVSQKVLNSSRKSKAQAYLKQIAATYYRYYNDNGYIPNAKTSVELAEKFAAEGELNNANLFVFPWDALSARVLRENIYPLDGHAWESGKELSIVLIGTIMRAVNTANTPVAYTRGLANSGRWSQDSPFGKEGGFIAFLDGQVRWYTDLSLDGGKLAIENSATSNMLEAICYSGGAALSSKTP